MQAVEHLIVSLKCIELNVQKVFTSYVIIDHIVTFVFSDSGLDRSEMCVQVETSDLKPPVGEPGTEIGDMTESAGLTKGADMSKSTESGPHSTLKQLENAAGQKNPVCATASVNVIARPVMKLIQSMKIKKFPVVTCDDEVLPQPKVKLVSQPVDDCNGTGSMQQLEPEPFREDIARDSMAAVRESAAEKNAENANNVPTMDDNLGFIGDSMKAIKCTCTYQGKSPYNFKKHMLEMHPEDMAEKKVELKHDEVLMTSVNVEKEVKSGPVSKSRLIQSLERKKFKIPKMIVTCNAEILPPPVVDCVGTSCKPFIRDTMAAVEESAVERAGEKKTASTVDESLPVLTDETTQFEISGNNICHDPPKLSKMVSGLGEPDKRRPEMQNCRNSRFTAATTTDELKRLGIADGTAPRNASAAEILDGTTLCPFRTSFKKTYDTADIRFGCNTCTYKCKSIYNFKKHMLELHPVACGMAEKKRMETQSKQDEVLMTKKPGSNVRKMLNEEIKQLSLSSWNINQLDRAVKKSKGTDDYLSQKDGKMEQWQKNLKLVLSGNESIFLCPLCRAEFGTDQNDFKNHLKSNHGITTFKRYLQIHHKNRQSNVETGDTEGEKEYIPSVPKDDKDLIAQKDQSERKQAKRPCLVSVLEDNILQQEESSKPTYIYALDQVEGNSKQTFSSRCERESQEITVQDSERKRRKTQNAKGQQETCHKIVNIACLEGNSLRIIDGSGGDRQLLENESMVIKEEKDPETKTGNIDVKNEVDVEMSSSLENVCFEAKEQIDLKDELVYDD